MTRRRRNTCINSPVLHDKKAENYKKKELWYEMSRRKLQKAQISQKIVILSQGVQKQLFVDLLKTHRKTPVSESYFSEPTGFKSVTSQQKDSTKGIFL